jgi:hypothetical protein
VEQNVIPHFEQAIAASLTGSGPIESMGGDVHLVKLLKERTLGIRTIDVLHFFA